MATLPPSANPFDPVLDIEHGIIDGKACAHAYYVAISEKSCKAGDSGPGATRDKVLLATVTEDALRMFPIHIRRDAHDYLTPKYDQLKTITIPPDDDGWPIPDSPEVFEELLSMLPSARCPSEPCLPPCVQNAGEASGGRFMYAAMYILPPSWPVPP